MNWNLSWNWRIVLIRIIINGVAIALAALILPGITVSVPSVINFLILGLTFGLLNAFIKPIIQFLTISFLFVTFGLVIVLVDTLMMYLLAMVLPDHLFVIQNFGAALLGGLLIALLTTFLENLFGLTPPVVDKTRSAPPPPAGPPLEQARFNELMAELKAVQEGVKTNGTK